MRGEAKPFKGPARNIVIAGRNIAMRLDDCHVSEQKTWQNINGPDGISGRRSSLRSPLHGVLSSRSCVRTRKHMVSVEESSSNRPNRCGSRGSQLMEARRKVLETGYRVRMPTFSGPRIELHRYNYHAPAFVGV
ncbi:hypothetical protein B296_00025239 [Ensete ventricosum]|uniref:Uncharacterized protein n=1 Tax=Ensete ventricosum TaxID=4639 RepID=A0A426YPG7_ENSVE|nr:hypothetical protein B296_00025239 [Ensete ventricosum]